MACFLVPTAEAIAVKLAEKTAFHDTESTEEEAKLHVPFRRKLKWLSNMLFGGSALLAFEHLWHGEISPYFPFLTAAENSADLQEMLHEMSTVGVSMAVFVTAIWGVMVAVTGSMEKKGLDPAIVKKDE